MLLILLGELGARVAATFLKVEPLTTVFESDTWFRFSPSVGWERRPGYAGPELGPGRSVDAAGYLKLDSDQVADTSGYRVLFVGSSRTLGAEVLAESTFVERLETLVSGLKGINVGVRGYSSLQAQIVVAQRLPVLKPDLVVVEAGGDDARYVLSRDEMDSPEHFRSLSEAAGSWTAHLNRAIGRLYLVRSARTVLRRLGVVESPQQETRVDALQPRVDTSGFRRNLEGIATAAGEAGIPVVFLLLGDSPFDTRDLRQGIAYFEAGNFRLGRAHFRVPLDLGRDVGADGQHVARLYLAAMHRAEGDTAAADAILKIPVQPPALYHGKPLFMDVVYHKVMRSVARDHHGELVDAAPVLDRHPAAFADGAGHLTATGHQLVAELLARTIIRLRGARP